MLKEETLYLQAIAKSACPLNLNRRCRGGVVGSGFGGYGKQRELIDAVVHKPASKNGAKNLASFPAVPHI